MALAIVTGGTKGIGKAICDILMENGFDISITARNIDDLNNLKSDYNSRYPNQDVQVFQVDMSRKGEVINFAEEVCKATDQCRRKQVLGWLDKDISIHIIDFIQWGDCGA